jgi:hypothetical protein
MEFPESHWPGEINAYREEIKMSSGRPMANCALQRHALRGWPARCMFQVRAWSHRAAERGHRRARRAAGSKINRQVFPGIDWAPKNYVVAHRFGF